MSVSLDRQPCRIHPAVIHYQIAVCPWDAKVLDEELRCPEGCPVKEPAWRCIQFTIDHESEIRTWLATIPDSDGNGGPS